MNAYFGIRQEVKNINEQQISIPANSWVKVLDANPQRLYVRFSKEGTKNMDVYPSNGDPGGVRRGETFLLAYTTDPLNIWTGEYWARAEQNNDDLNIVEYSF